MPYQTQTSMQSLQRTRRKRSRSFKVHTSGRSTTIGQKTVHQSGVQRLPNALITRQLDDVTPAMIEEQEPVSPSIAHNVSCSLPQASPITESIHTVLDQQRYTRRTWLRRLGVAGFFSFVTVSGGIAGLLSHELHHEKQQLTLQKQKEHQQLEAARTQATTTGYQQGYTHGHQQGYQQALHDIASQLSKMNGVTPSDALTSASNLFALCSVFVAPLAKSGISIETMLNDALACRGIASQFGTNTDGVDALITLLESWRGNESSLPGSLDTLINSPLSASSSYLHALRQVIVGLDNSHT